MSGPRHDGSGTTLRCALTIDDAPTIAAGVHVASDPTRMDKMREVLQRAGITSCVAFVRSAQAVDHEGCLSRWLEAGYELGNHTHSHLRAGAVTAERFLEDVAKCDAILTDVGAFEGDRPRYFRFPYLDRGADDDSRRQIDERIKELGYRIAHGSVDLFDHAYEEQMGAAVAAGDQSAIEAVGRRYVDVALRSLVFEDRRTVKELGRPVKHILYLHFGEVSGRYLDRILEGLATLEVEFCDLEEAMHDSFFEEFDRNPDHNGRVPPAMLRTGGFDKVKRKLALWSERAGLFRQGALGPRWPHLE